MPLGAVAVIGFDNSRDLSESAERRKSWWHWVKRFANWFCGLEASVVMTPKQTNRLQDMTSLHQAYKARAALYTALIILVSLDIFLYAFFSTGSDFGLLRDNPPPDLLVGKTTTTLLPGNQLTVLLNHTQSYT